MSVYAKVRRLRLREGLSISEIARRTSLSRNTIKKWLAEPVRREMRYRREPMVRKVDAHRQWLRDALAVDAMRPRKERRTARRLHEQLKAEGFAGDYSRVTEAIRAIRAEAGAVTARAAYVPLAFAWGEAFQFDWSEEGIVIGGIWRRVQV
jgi:transposase